VMNATLPSTRPLIFPPTHLLTDRSGTLTVFGATVKNWL
jgi:hypothetical protein